MIKAPALAHRDYPQVPAGTHVARLYKIMNLGARIQTFEGKAKNFPETLINFTFEFPEETHEFTDKDIDGNETKVLKPLVLSREFTLSMGPKSNLRKFVEGMIGVSLTDGEAQNFDLEELLGKSCLVTVAHKQSKDGTRTYSNMIAASPLMKGMQEPHPYNKNVVFDINTATIEEIADLPQYLREKVAVSNEYKARFGRAEELTAEDVPF